MSTKVRELGSVYCSSRGGTEEITIVVCSYYNDVAGVEKARFMVETGRFARWRLHRDCIYRAASRIE